MNKYDELKKRSLENKRKKLEDKEKEKDSNKEYLKSSKDLMKKTIVKVKKKISYPDKWEIMFKQALELCSKEIENGAENGNCLLLIEHSKYKSLSSYMISHKRYFKAFLKRRFKELGFKHVFINFYNINYMYSYYYGDYIYDSDYDSLQYKTVACGDYLFVQLNLKYRPFLNYNKINFLNMIDVNNILKTKNEIFTEQEYQHKYSEWIDIYKISSIGKKKKVHTINISL